MGETRVAKRRHDCFDKLNKSLEQYNTRLVEVFTMDLDTRKFSKGITPMFATEKIDTRKRTGRAKSVFFIYCPVCGKKLDA